MTRKFRKPKPAGLTRKQRSRLEQEKRLEKFILWGATIVVVAIVGILGYGLVFEKIVKAREPVAVVGNTPITTAEFQARVRFLRMQMQRQLWGLQQRQAAVDPMDSNNEFLLQYLQEEIRNVQTELEPENATTIGDQALNQLLQEELVRQEAERRGIVVTPGEVQQQIELSFGYDSNPATPEPTASSPLTPTDALTPTEDLLPTPTPMTEESFQQLYADFLNESLKPLGISEKQYRSWLEASLLTQKLQEQMAVEIPTTADQVKLNVYSVGSEGQASELVARLDAGEDFQILASELNEDEDWASYATELGWLPRELLEDDLGTDLADQAFSLEVGESSQPVADPQGGYNILEVTGHEEREIAVWVYQQLVEKEFQAWLDAQQFLVERRTYQDRVPMEPY
jgi:parvulin-like peptidyl-prolyl isomerase